MRWALWITTTLGIALGVYIASPLIALHGIASAVEAQDAAALSERLEFPALRRSLTKQIVAEYLKLTGKKLPIQAMARTLVVSVADPIVARLMTVRAILDLLGKGDAGEKAKLPIDRAPFTASSFQSLWRLWLESDYRGSNFYVYLPPKGLREEQFRVHLRIIRWHWWVVGLELPEDLKERLARELIKLTQDRINPVQ